jgi:hypothetical protein
MEISFELNLMIKRFRLRIEGIPNQPINWEKKDNAVYAKNKLMFTFDGWKIICMKGCTPFTFNFFYFERYLKPLKCL